MSPRRTAIQQYHIDLARKGGHGRAAKLTKARRTAIAKQAAAARWAKRAKPEP